jgi:hypothetical protein
MLEDRNSDIFFLPQKHQSDETEARMAVDKKAWRSSNEQERHYSRRLFFARILPAMPASSGVEDHFITRQVHRPPVPVALCMTRRNGI